MATGPRIKPIRELDYPTGDGKPVAETPLHRDILLDLIVMLKWRYLQDPNVYVSGNMMMYYVRGDKRRHVSPDVFVVLDIPKLPERSYYLVWEEGKGPDVVIEVSSKSTRREDLQKKFQLYRDVLKVREYFLFDPEEEYLKPSLQGYRLQRGIYVPIEPVRGALPSRVLRLHLVRHGLTLRLSDPATGQIILTPEERAEEAGRRAEQERHRAEQERQRAEQERQRAEQERQQTEQALAEIDRLKREIEELRHQRPP